MPRKIFRGYEYQEDGTNIKHHHPNQNSIYGDGNDGSYTSGDNLTPGEVYEFTDFTLSDGDTLTSTEDSSKKPIIVKVTGDIEINGTIDLKGKGYLGGYGNNEPVNNGDGFNSDRDKRYAGAILTLAWYDSGVGATRRNRKMNISGTGGEGCFAEYYDGAHRGRKGLGYKPEKWFNDIYGELMIAPGTGGGGAGDELVDGSTTDYTGGGGASYDADGYDGGGGDGTNREGGNGGGAMLMICSGDFILSSTGEINIQGEDVAGDGGAGGGGMFWALYKGTLTDNGTKLVSGGSSDNGGDGADGTIKLEAVNI